MGNIKKYNDFVDEKFILKINENLFDKIESMIKGQSDKGKIIKQILDKNGIKETGFLYSIQWVGGSEPGKTQLSNPIDYLQYQNICKVDANENLIITDEKSKRLKVPDVMSFLAITNKEFIEGTGPGHGAFNLFKVGSEVNKESYKFDLSIDIPTVTINKSTYYIPKQDWIPTNKPETVNLDDDITEIGDDEILSLKNVINIVTLQNVVDMINNHPKKSELIDYLVNTLKFKSDKQIGKTNTTETTTVAPASAQPSAPASTTNTTTVAPA
jgi:hypothetical protein